MGLLVGDATLNDKSELQSNDWEGGTYAVLQGINPVKTSPGASGLDTESQRVDVDGENKRIGEIVAVLEGCDLELGGDGCWGVLDAVIRIVG